MGERFGAVDIGSNSLLLTIIEKANPYRILHDEAHVTGLAKGLTKDGMIQPERQKKSEAILKNYGELVKKYQVKKFKAVTTEALRRAANGLVVKKSLEENLQYPIELIDGNREAELSFFSVQKEYSDKKISKIVFDIGGASTELCLGNEDGISKKISLKVGSVVATEKFQLQKPASPEEALKYIESLIAESPFKEAKVESVGIGVAGTITTLAAMILKLEKYDREKVHLLKIKKSDVDSLVKKVLSLSTDERGKIPGLTLDRADVFGGGILIIKALMDYFKWPEIICMDSGVRFGLLYEMLE